MERVKERSGERSRDKQRSEGRRDRKRRHSSNDLKHKSKKHSKSRKRSRSKRKKRSRHSSTSSSSSSSSHSSSSSSSGDSAYKKKKSKKRKRSKKSSKRDKSPSKLRSHLGGAIPKKKEGNSGPSPPQSKQIKNNVKAPPKPRLSDPPPVIKSMAPMTKEEWEKRQSVIRREVSPTTGRTRLIKGDGEIIEEIVSRDRHLQINKAATKGDGHNFQKQISQRVNKY